jgi:hypothetical protein
VGDEEATTSVVSGEKLLRTIILDNKLELYGLYVSFWSSYLAWRKTYSYNCPLWNIEGFEKWSNDFGNLCHLQEEWIMVKRGCALMVQN